MHRQRLADLPAAGIIGKPLCFSARDFHESFLHAACYHQARLTSTATDSVIIFAHP